MSDLQEQTRGQWPGILAALAGLTDQQLTDRHQPCPLCGGEDRYRFDDKDGNGTWFCNQCGGKNQQGGAGSGMDMLMRRTGWPFKEAAERVEQHLGLPTKKPSSTTARAQVTSTTYHPRRSTVLRPTGATATPSSLPASPARRSAPCPGMAAPGSGRPRRRPAHCSTWPAWPSALMPLFSWWKGRRHGMPPCGCSQPPWP